MAQTIGITGDNTINQCETGISYTVSMQNDSGSPLTDLVVTAGLGDLPGFSYVSGTTNINVDGGAAFCTANPSLSGTDLVWDIDAQCGGPFTLDDGQTLNVTFSLETNCTAVSGSLHAQIAYEMSETPSFADSALDITVLQPVIHIAKTRADEPIDCGQLIEWTITVQNNSGYTLPIIWVEDTMDAAFTYSSSVGDPTYTVDNGTVNGQVVTWEVMNLPHNGMATLTLRATTDTSPCSPNLDNTVLAWWGCGAADGSSATKPGEDPPDNTLCLTTSSVSAVRTETREPTMSFLDIALNPTSVDSCDDSTEVSVTIQNTGPTDASDVDLVITLPAGLSYIAGSSEVCVGTDETCATAAVGDPTIVGNQLRYYNIADKGSDLADLVQANGGNDTVMLTFSVRSNCYATADVGFRLYYYDCCGDTQYSITASENLTSLYPALSITKTPQNSQVDCGENQTWAITVTNDGAGNAQVVRIEDTLGDWVDYVSSAPAATLIGGQTYGWEINDLAAGSSQSFTITGQLNPDAPQNDCSALLRQDNARAIWGCGTTGDAIDHDPTTTAYDCTYATWANAPAANLAMPDLVVTAITPAISATADGAFSGAISVTVRNQGDGVASGGFQVSVDDGNGWTGTGSYSSDLAVGAETTVTIDASSWNPDCTPCTYNFTASVDSGDTVCECREDNNDFGPQAYSPAIPDLEVDSDTLAISCVADGQCRVSGTVTLRNAGCAGTLTQDVPMRFTLLSGAGCGGAQVAQWTQTFTGVNIPAGGTQAFAITDYNIVGNACTSASGCQFSMHIEADYSATISECDGTNNTLCSDKTFTIPDLRVDSDTLAISCSVDGQCRILGDLTIANDGCGANFVTNIPIRIRVYNNNAACSGANGNLVFTQAGVNIPAGGTQTFAINRTLTRNLCTNSTGCQVAVGVELDYSNAICECANTNNNYCSPNKTVSIPDLQVTGDTLSVNCLQDGQVRVSGNVTIANTGCNAAVVGNLPVRFTLFSNIYCGGAQLAQWTETFAGANIAAGSSQVFTIANRDLITNICTNSTGGQVSLRVEADPAPSTTCECNGGNNARCSNKTVSVPDLRITAVTPSTTCISDGNLSGTVQVTVNNNGSAAANNVPVRLTSDCGHTFTDQTIASLAAGASTTLISSFTPDISRCTCTFTAAADPDNVVCECDGTNNSLAAAPHTSPVPDLTITDIDFSNVTWANDTVAGSVSVTVNNQGCGTANNFQVSLSTDGCLDFTNQTVVSLAAGASTVLTFNISGSWADCADGSCQFTAAVDPADAVCEYDGINNTRSETYNSFQPDLVVTDIDFSGITCVNDNISGSVAVTINNQGFGNAANFQVSLATDGCLNFTNQTVANLAAGASTTVTFNVSGSWADCTDCTCQFTATVDPANTVYECNGDNNTRTETFTSTLPDLTVNSVTPSVTGLSDGNLQGSVTVNVSNIGCGNANNAVVRLTSSCGYVLVDQTVNLAAGASTDVTFNYTPNCASCTCTFTAVVDPDATVCEGDGANNALTSAPFTMTVPDIEVQANTLTATCSGDGQCAIAGTVILVNDGCGDNLTADVPMRFTLFDNTGCSGNQLSQWTQTFTGVNLASGGGTQVFTITSQTVAADLCANSTNCQVSIHVEADYSGSIYECDGSNNTYCADNKSVDIPNLEVQSDTLGISCTGDGQVTISGAVTLSNNGCGANLASDIPMRFTLFDNTGGSGNQLAQWTESFTGVNIAAGGGTQVFTITPQIVVADLCANSTDCQVSLRVEPDYNHSICECDGTDQPYLTDRSISIPDLTVNSVTPSVISGTVTVNVSNIGCDTASGAVVRLVSDCGISFTDQAVDLAASSSQDVVFASPALPGGCTFTATVDPDNALCECSGTNNTAAAGAISRYYYLPIILKNYTPPVPPPAAPDLVVDSLVATSSAVTVTIRNAGTAAVNDAFWVDVYFNPTQTPSLNHPWNTIASHGVVWGVTDPIPAGGSLVLTTGGKYYFGPPDSSAPPLPVGANVYALVDSVDYSTTYGAVRESNEGNNLFGPVVSTTSVGSKGAPSVDRGQPASREGLPPR